MTLAEKAEMIGMLLEAWHDDPPATAADFQAAARHLAALFDDVWAAVDPDYAEARTERIPTSQRN